MTEEIKPAEVKIMKQIQENLQTVYRGLGIETRNHALELSKLKCEQGIVLSREAQDIWLYVQKQAEQKQTLADMRTKAEAMFAANQVRFAESRIMFNRLRAFIPNKPSYSDFQMGDVQ